MKKIWFSYIVVWIVILLISPAPPVVFASNPTVTVTKTDLGARANRYNISFTTLVANVDSAFIYNDASTWYAIDGVGAHVADSLVTLECYSSEATADSVRFAIVYQISSAASPTVTAGAIPNSGWVTAKVDSATLNNKTPGVNPGISSFAKVKLAGQATKMRIIVYEINSTAKDAAQTVTLRLLIPKR